MSPPIDIDYEGEISPGLLSPDSCKSRVAGPAGAVFKWTVKAKNTKGQGKLLGYVPKRFEPLIRVFVAVYKSHLALRTKDSLKETRYMRRLWDVLILHFPQTLDVAGLDDWLPVPLQGWLTRLYYRFGHSEKERQKFEHAYMVVSQAEPEQIYLASVVQLDWADWAKLLREEARPKWLTENLFQMLEGMGSEDGTGVGGNDIEGGSSDKKNESLPDKGNESSSDEGSESPPNKPTDEFDHKSTDSPSLTDIAALQQVLAESKNIIAVAGAGLSVASGIPTFRGTGGMWRRFDAISLATPKAFQKNPARVWQFYHYRREKARSASPNAAHYVLAQLSLPAFRHTLAPDSTFTLITQNVDGLSQRALDATLARAPPSERASSTPAHPHMLEMHGRLFDVRCTVRRCGHVEWDDASPVCPALAGTEVLVDAGVIEPEIAEKDLPRCRKCGALARPGVVWFDEIPRHLETINELVDKADLCLVVGTSSTVYPAAGCAYSVRENGGKVAVFNLERSDGDENADFLFLGPCESTLPKALRHIEEVE